MRKMAFVFLSAILLVFMTSCDNGTMDVNVLGGEVAIKEAPGTIPSLPVTTLRYVEANNLRIKILYPNDGIPVEYLFYMSHPNSENVVKPIAAEYKGSIEGGTFWEISNSLNDWNSKRIGVCAISVNGVRSDIGWATIN